MVVVTFRVAGGCFSSWLCGCALIEDEFFVVRGFVVSTDDGL